MPASNFIPRISHEVPFSLMEKSREFNDYDYALAHLLDENEEYRNFFYESKKLGREIYLDNSLHELGYAYDSDRLIHWVNELNPSTFIVPDVWQNASASIKNASEWKPEEFGSTTLMAVVQATTIHEAALCYKAYKTLGYKKIAFTYGNSYYNDVVPHPNKDMGKALGRLSVIMALIETRIIDMELDTIHLLGCSVPQEFGWYTGIPAIKSLDTSNPVMAGIEGMAYSGMGLPVKPEINMNLAQEMEFRPEEINLIEYNVRAFREINWLDKT